MIRAALLLCALSLAGCSVLNPATAPNPGNPSGTPYAGEPGSVFDTSTGPPRPVRPEPDLNMPPVAPPASVTSGTLPPISPPPR